jgi:hypothetical protein
VSDIYCGGGFWRQIYFGVGFGLHGGGIFLLKKKKLLFCAVVVQQGQFYISLFT